MRNGISVNDYVKLKDANIIGKVVGVSEVNDRLPAELTVVYRQYGEILTLKAMADAVIKLTAPELGELLGLDKLDRFEPLISA